MECLKLCVAFVGLASTACDSAAVGPLSYLLQYKRSVLANPTGLAAFNGFGGVPFDFGGYGQPGYAAYNHQPGLATYNHQPGLAAYNHQPGLAAYNHQPGLAAYNHQPGLLAYNQPGFGAYGLDDLRPYQARALAPAAEFQYGAATPAAGYPFAVHYKLSPAAPQLLYAPAVAAPTAQQSKTAPAAAMQDKARQVRVMSPTVAAEPTRFQIPSSYQPVATSDAATAAATAAPDLFLELRPPHYSEPSIDYSKSPDGGSSLPHVDFGSAPSGSSNVNRGESYPAPGHAYHLVPSISYTLPTHAYSHTEPNAVIDNSPYAGPSSVAGAGDGKTASKPVADAANDFASSNGLYGGEPAESGGPVSSPFANAYYGVSSARGSSNPTSANTYGDSNSIQSGTHGNDKPIAGNVRSTSSSSSSDKRRDTSNLARSINYFGGDYKNVQRDTY